MFVNSQVTYLICCGILLQCIINVNSFVASTGEQYTCQGSTFTLESCASPLYPSAQIKIKSITVLTNSDADAIKNRADCRSAVQCIRTIHSVTDVGLSDEYKHLYKWIYHICEGKTVCDTNGTLPLWWQLVDDSKSSDCDSTQYFGSTLIHYECIVGEAIPTAQPAPDTTPRTTPTTPKPTTPFPVYVNIYQPTLEGREKVILGVAIGLALAILLVLLIVLYCCERYRHSKRLGKLLRRLGAPQADDDAFDELDYGRQEAWQDETQNLDAIGEYTGVKPDEFLTLDKHTMERSGQIMYDTPIGSMAKGNSCSTLDRLDRAPKGSPLLSGYRHQGPTDYETAENLELERRMAETALQYESEM